jgi:hypothetical protein
VRGGQHRLFEVAHELNEPQMSQCLALCSRNPIEG